MTEHSQQAMNRLNEAGLRPTRQRLALAELLIRTAPRHVTAEELYHEASLAGIHVSLATIYNTLHQFTQAGLMGEVVVGSGQSYFDTTAHAHHHFFDKSTGEIFDVPDDAVDIGKVPQAPAGKVIERVDVVIRIRNATPEELADGKAVSAG